MAEYKLNKSPINLSRNIRQPSMNSVSVHLYQYLVHLAVLDLVITKYRSNNEFSSRAIDFLVRFDSLIPSE